MTQLVAACCLAGALFSPMAATDTPRGLSIMMGVMAFGVVTSGLLFLVSFLMPKGDY